MNRVVMILALSDRCYDRHARPREKKRREREARRLAEFRAMDRDQEARFSEAIYPSVPSPCRGRGRKKKRAPPASSFAGHIAPALGYVAGTKRGSRGEGSMTL